MDPMRSKCKKEYKIKGGLVIIPNPLSNRSLLNPKFAKQSATELASLNACCTTTSQSFFNSYLALTIKI